jgi:Winged helix DNA-binding domain
VRDGGPVATVEHLLAIQAQDLRAARLAVRARTAGGSAAAVDGALADRSLVVGWLLRGTLHLVAAADFGWLLGLIAPTRAATSARRLSQERVAPDAADRAVAIVERALSDDGPLTRPELAERIAGAGIRTEGQATPHLLMLCVLRGVAVLGPVRPDGTEAFALARDWLGAAPPTALTGDERDRALAELARRYLTAHGPATAADLATWSGLPRRDARAGLDAIAGELAVEGDMVSLVATAVADADAAHDPAASGADAPHHPAAGDPADADPGRIPPRLLGAFDPYILGWKSRAFAVAPEHAERVHPGGGMVRAVATVDGRAVGTWTRKRRTAEPLLELFADVAPGDIAALRADGQDVLRFEGLA